MKFTRTGRLFYYKNSDVTGAVKTLKKFFRGADIDVTKMTKPELEALVVAYTLHDETLSMAHLKRGITIRLLTGALIGLASYMVYKNYKKENKNDRYISQ